MLQNCKEVEDDLDINIFSSFQFRLSRIQHFEFPYFTLRDTMIQSYSVENNFARLTTISCVSKKNVFFSRSESCLIRSLQAHSLRQQQLHLHNKRISSSGNFSNNKFSVACNRRSLAIAQCAFIPLTPDLLTPEPPWTTPIDE